MKNRDDAIEILKKYNPIENKSDWNHYLMSEAIMKSLAEKFGEDIEYWGLIGLLHDVDWGITKNDTSNHCIKCVEILKDEGFDEKFISNIQSHAYGLDIIPSLKEKIRTQKIEYSLVAAETLTGLIYAYALMRGRKIDDMEVKGLKKKFKDKIFAANCNRELIQEIEKAGLGLDEFFEISIMALKNIKRKVGLE